MSLPDRRGANRLKGRLPLELNGGIGFTRDFSSSGIFFETDRPFAIGEPVEFCIPLENLKPGELVRVQCRGKVVRVEQTEDKTGVAVTIDSYQF